MKCRVAWGVAALGVIAAGSAGCGLKGPLEMPEKSTNIVIRGPEQPSTGSSTAAPGEPAPAQPTKPAEPSTTKAPAADRLPPPPLPGGNPGSARGG